MVTLTSQSGLPGESDCKLNESQCNLQPESSVPQAWAGQQHQQPCQTQGHKGDKGPLHLLQPWQFLLWRLAVALQGLLCNVFPFSVFGSELGPLGLCLQF